MPRKFSKDTKTWIAFEKLFLELPDDKYPYIIPNLTKGKAVNLAQGLNGCQRHWAQERGVPTNMLRHSAKAKQVGDFTWIVEISISPKHTNTRGGGEWINDILENLQTDIPQIQSFTNEYTNQDKVKDANESVFEKWLTNAPAQAQSGVDEPKQPI